MFKKLVIASAVFAASSGIAFAGHSYKGDRDYKGEMAAPTCPTCPTYSYLCGPYVGASLGVRNNYTGEPSVVYKGIEGILSLGYGGAVSPMFYLAGELFVGDSAQVRNFKFNGNGVKSTWSYGFDLIPGIMLTDYVMGYVRAGVVRTRFSDQGTSATGWQVGIGGQTNLCQNWDLRGEYVFSAYRSVTGIGHPQADQFNLGVVYKFM